MSKLFEILPNKDFLIIKKSERLENNMIFRYENSKL